MAKPLQIMIDETPVRITGNWSWAYDAIELNPKLLLDVEFFGRRGTNIATALLYEVTEKHNLPAAEFLVGGARYLTAPLD